VVAARADILDRRKVVWSCWEQRENATSGGLILEGRAEDHMQEQDPLWLLIIAILNLFRRDSRNIEALVGIASRSF
jgi:hypothetical protein